MSVILSMGQPKARKAHECSWCPDDIKVGELYERWVGIWDGDPPATMKMHKDCLRAANRAEYYDDEPICAAGHVRGADCDH